MRELAAGRLHEVPWCRWRLADAPLGPVRAALDRRRGLRPVARTSCSSPRPTIAVSDETFEVLRSTVLSTPLDRARPLWQVFLVPRLARRPRRDGRQDPPRARRRDGGAADREAVHRLRARRRSRGRRCAGVPRAARAPPAGRSTPRATPSATASARCAPGADAVTHPRSSIERGRARRQARSPPRSPRTCCRRRRASQLNGRIGTRRTLIGYHAPRSLLRAARGRGGTLNDVGLTAVAGALRTLALRRGDDPHEPLKTMVPVSMRRIGEEDAGNQIAMVYMPLPIHLRDERRAAGVRARADRAPEAHRPPGGHAGLRPGRRARAGRRCARRSCARWRRRASSTSRSRSRRRRAARCTCSAASSRRSTPSCRSPRATRSRSGWCATATSCSSAATPTPIALPEVHELPRLLQGELEELAPRPRRGAAGRRRRPRRRHRSAAAAAQRADSRLQRAASLTPVG